MSEHEAGRALDALIAEKVFGLTDVREMEFEGESWWSGQLSPDRRTHPEQRVHLRHYSTDIASAWAVVEMVRTAGRGIAVADTPEGYEVTFDHMDSGTCAIRKAATLPLAICRAALDAVAANPTEEVDAEG